MARFISRPTTLGSANTPVSIRSLIAALSPAFSGITSFTQLIIINNTSDGGNLILSDDSTIASEGDNTPITDSINFGPMGILDPPVDGNEMYLLSATANKKLNLVGIVRF